MTTSTHDTPLRPAPRVVVVGAGHLGQALVRRLLDTGHPQHRLHGVTGSPESARRVHRSCGISTSSAGDPDPLDAEVALLAVPPTAADAALADLARRGSGVRALATFVAGRPIERCTLDTDPDGPAGPRTLPVHRVATNVMSVRRGGLLAVSSAPGAPRTDDPALTVMTRVGRVVHIDEELQDAAACTVGSGAALLALAVESLVAALGADDDTGRAFAVDAATGAAEIVAQRLASPEHSWGGLATKGGLTEAGVAVLEQRGVAAAYRDAVAAGITRARERREPR